MELRWHVTYPVNELNMYVYLIAFDESDQMANYWVWNAEEQKWNEYLAGMSMRPTMKVDMRFGMKIEKFNAWEFGQTITRVLETAQKNAAETGCPTPTE